MMKCECYGEFGVWGLERGNCAGNLYLFVPAEVLRDSPMYARFARNEGRD